MNRPVPSTRAATEPVPSLIATVAFGSHPCPVTVTFPPGCIAAGPIPNRGAATAAAAPGTVAGLTTASALGEERVTPQQAPAR